MPSAAPISRLNCLVATNIPVMYRFVEGPRVAGRIAEGKPHRLAIGQAQILSGIRLDSSNKKKLVLFLLCWPAKASLFSSAHVIETENHVSGFCFARQREPVTSKASAHFSSRCQRWISAQVVVSSWVYNHVVQIR